MNLKRILIFITILITLSLGVCYIFRKNIKSRFTPSFEQFGNIHIAIKNDTCYVSSKILSTNKSFFKINIDTIKYKVSVFNKIYLKSEKFVGIKMESYSTDTVDFALKIPYKIIIKDMKAERKKGDSASYSIFASIQYSTFLGKGEIPINKSAKLKIPQPPDVEILDIKYTKVRMKSIRANVRIRIINYSNVALSIKKLSYTMTIVNQGKLKGNHNAEINIKPRETSIINLPIEIKPKHIVKTLFDVMRNKDSYDYTLKLDAILESSGPINDTYAIDIIKQGKMELKK